MVGPRRAASVRASAAAAALLASALLGALAARPAAGAGKEGSRPPLYTPFFNPQAYLCGPYVDAGGNFALVGAVPLYTRTYVDRALGKAFPYMATLVVRESCEPRSAPDDPSRVLGTLLTLELVHNRVILCRGIVEIDPDGNRVHIADLAAGMVSAGPPAVSPILDALRAQLGPEKAAETISHIRELWRKGIEMRTGIRMPCSIEVKEVRVGPLASDPERLFVAELDLKLVGVPPRPRPDVPGLGPDGRMTLRLLLHRPRKVKLESGGIAVFPPQGRPESQRLLVLHPKSARLRGDAYQQAR